VTVTPPAAPPDPSPGEVAAATERERPLRKDAERNRQRILEAAATVFAARGLDVTMDDIAAAAGVGVGTVYRRFPDKEQLIDALFERGLSGILVLAEEAVAMDDAWAGLVFFLESVQRLLVSNRALTQLTHSSVHGRQGVARCRAQLKEPIDQLVRRAQASGAARPDLAGRDMGIITLMVGVVADYAAEVAPEVWRRYLAIILDGIRAGAERQPLPVPALEQEEFDRAMERWKPGWR
jgi:AcrR family transcriptional regulator